MTAEEMDAIRERDTEWDGGDPRDRWQTRERIDDAFRDRRALLAEVDALRVRVAELRAFAVAAYCVKGRFETCGDPFCVDARAELDRILGAHPDPAPGPERG